MARRHQDGCHTIRGKRPKRWFSYREDVIQKDGTVQRVRRKRPLGFVDELSERASRKMVEPILARINSEAKIPPRAGKTLAEFVEEWLTNVPQRATTRRAAESHLRAHIRPQLGALLLTEINTRVVQSFVAHLENNGCSCKTIKNILSTLSSILRTAKEWDYATPGFEFARLFLPDEGVKEEPLCRTDAEAKRILAAASEPLGTILLVLAVHGLRISEALALRVSDLDFEGKILRIRQGLDCATRVVQGLKSKASRANLPMPDKLAERLRYHLATRPVESDLLFTNAKGRPIAANWLRERRLYPLLKRLGISKGGFKSFRHGTASALYAARVSPVVATKQLRHSNPNITLSVYGHLVGDEHRAAITARAARLLD